MGAVAANIDRSRIGQQIGRRLVVDVAPERGTEPNRQCRRQLRCCQARAARTRRLTGSDGVPVAVGDSSFIIAHQPTGIIGTAADAAGGIAVTDSSAVFTY